VDEAAVNAPGPSAPNSAGTRQRTRIAIRFMAASAKSTHAKPVVNSGFRSPRRTGRMKPTALTLGAVGRRHEM